MPKDRKSPQEKKSLVYERDHFTFSRHSSFPKTWRRKKTYVNREYRRKSDEILLQVKTGMTAKDAALAANDLTAKLFQKSVTRQRLQKHDTVTVGEKVKVTLAKREERVGRRERRNEPYDRAATSAVQTLNSLEGKKFADSTRRASILCSSKNALESAHLRRSNDPLDQALYFLYQLVMGSAYEIDALRRNQELNAAMNTWITKANRILARDQLLLNRKVTEKQKAGQIVNALRRDAFH